MFSHVISLFIYVSGPLSTAFLPLLFLESSVQGKCFTTPIKTPGEGISFWSQNFVIAFLPPRPSGRFPRYRNVNVVSTLKPRTFVIIAATSRQNFSPLENFRERLLLKCSTGRFWNTLKVFPSSSCLSVCSSFITVYQCLHLLCWWSSFSFEGLLHVSTVTYLWWAGTTMLLPVLFLHWLTYLSLKLFTHPLCNILYIIKYIQTKKWVLDHNISIPLSSQVYPPAGSSVEGGTNVATSCATSSI